MDSPPELTPPWAQVHFWAVIAASVISLLVALGVVGPDFAKSHEDVVNAVALLASVLGPAIYALARGIAQHGHQKAVATVLAARLNAPTPLTHYTATLGGDSGLSAIGVILFVVALIIVLSLGFAVNHLLLLLIIVALLLLLL